MSVREVKMNFRDEGRQKQTLKQVRDDDFGWGIPSEDRIRENFITVST